VDVNRLSMGEKIAGIAAALLFVSSFLTFWAKVEVESVAGFGGGTARFNGWEAYAFHVDLAFILALLVVVWVGIRATETNINLPVGAGQVLAVLGGAIFLLLLIALLTGPADGGLEFSGVEVSRGPLLFVGVILGAAIAYGGYMAMKEDTTATPAYQAPAAPPPGPPPPAS
jgi:cytochrome b561